MHALKKINKTTYTIISVLSIPLLRMCTTQKYCIYFSHHTWLISISVTPIKAHNNYTIPSTTPQLKLSLCYQRTQLLYKSKTSHHLLLKITECHIGISFITYLKFPIQLRKTKKCLKSLFFLNILSLTFITHTVP